MSKFRLKMKLQGLEVEIEGAREDANRITQNLGQQLASVLKPAGAIIEGQGQLVSDSSSTQIAQIGDSSSEHKPRRRRAVSSSNGEDKIPAVHWTHDQAKYGTPKQGWSTSQKGIWLLHVVAAQAGLKGMPTKQLATTFNKHYREAGLIQVGKVNRDFGLLKAKKGVPSPVSEDTTKSPSEWFLTEEGQRQATSLVAEALGKV